jgi:hypothetical protein
MLLYVERIADCGMLLEEVSRSCSALPTPEAEKIPLSRCAEATNREVVKMIFSLLLIQRDE